MALDTKNVDEPDEVIRLNADLIPQNGEVTFEVDGGRVRAKIEFGERLRTVYSDRLKSVWWRHPVAPEVTGLKDERDNQFAVDQTKTAMLGVLETARCLLVNDPIQQLAAENKITQQLVALDNGFRVPDQLVTNNVASAESFLQGGVSIYKPLSHPILSMLPGDTHSRTGPTITVEPEHMEYIQGVESCPTWFQRRIAKKFEYRVTIIDGECFTARINPHTDDGEILDWREYDDLGFEYCELPVDVAQRVVAVVNDMNLVFACIDLIESTDGEYYLLDVNPCGQFLFVEEVVPELKMADALIALLRRGHRSRDAHHG